MSLVYILAASSMEGRPIQKIAAASNLSLPVRCGPNHLVLITTGMGPRNARRKAEAAFATDKPDAVLVIGLCGGLTPSLPEERVVAYTGCLSAESAGRPLPCSQTILDSVTGVLKSSSVSCDRVIGITAPRMAIRPNERASLARLGAAVVDMETYSVLDAAADAGIPAAVLRVVSDSADREFPDFNRALNEFGGLDGRKALKIALASPIRTARLLAANQRAMRRLAEALEIVLKADCFRNIGL